MKIASLALIPMLFVVVSCGKEKKKSEVDEPKSDLACLKRGEYCYQAKPGFGFVESYCTNDGGVTVLFCPENAVKICDKTSIKVSYYSEQYKDLTCED